MFQAPAPLTLTTGAVLRRLWRDWISSRKKAIAVALGLMALVSATSSAYPALIRYVFDALGAASADLIWQVPPLIIGITLIKGVAMYFQVRQVNQLALLITTSIQKAMTAHLIRADLALVMSAPVGEFVSRLMNDVLIVREAIIRLANNLIRDMLTIITMVAMMVWFDWLLTLIVLGVYPLAMQPIIKIGQKQRKQSSHLQEQMADVTSLLNETLTGSRMTRAYGLEGHETRRTALAFDQLFDRLFRLTLGRARIDPILEVLGGVAVAGVIALAGWRVVNGEMQVGDVAGFITALLMLVQPVRGLGTLNAVVQESAAASNRIFALLDAERQINDPVHPLALTAAKGALDFDQVSFSYGETATIDGISFSARPGQVTALVGPSGAGKTTVINLIPRLFDRSSGQITLDGHDITELTLDDLRRQMALVSQDAMLFNDTIRNNIRLGRLDASDDEVEAAAREAAAHDFIMGQADGYDTLVGEGGGRLSGGQRQRISIARAILRNAPVLLLDEATSALDAESEKQIQLALEKLAAGRTTIVVAHRLSTVQNADQILVMDQGRIVEAGQHSTLMKKDGLYARLCALQHFSE
ncbi:MAG: ABC transporter ATP-binding protein [Alphaproteobacteria bacterium]|nr:ABC transporter ATP-binding protein [Alphaproteobacteria bacterium]